MATRGRPRRRRAAINGGDSSRKRKKRRTPPPPLCHRSHLLRRRRFPAAQRNSSLTRPFSLLLAPTLEFRRRRKSSQSGALTHTTGRPGSGLPPSSSSSSSSYTNQNLPGVILGTQAAETLLPQDSSSISQTLHARKIIDNQRRFERKILVASQDESSPSSTLRVLINENQQALPASSLPTSRLSTRQTLAFKKQLDK